MPVLALTDSTDPMGVDFVKGTYISSFLKKSVIQVGKVFSSLSPMLLSPWFYSKMLLRFSCSSKTALIKMSLQQAWTRSVSKSRCLHRRSTAASSGPWWHSWWGSLATPLLKACSASLPLSRGVDGLSFLFIYNHLPGEASMTPDSRELFTPYSFHCHLYRVLGFFFRST